MNHYRRLIVGISSIRGVIGERLQPALAADFAASFGGYVGKGTVLVARDTRPSGIMLEHAVISGLLSAGCKVISAGVLPTPSLQLAVKAHGCSGAIEITASQHPQEWNSLKFINREGTYLSDQEMSALLDIYNQPEDGFIRESGYHALSREQDLFEEHAKKIWTRIDTAAIRAANLKIAIDCCNGVGAIYTKRFLKNIGVDEIIALNETPTGVFNHDPELTAENLTELSECVKANQCDAGFAQDPDGDTMILLDETGKIYNEQQSILIPCMRILERTPGDISASIQTTAALEELVQKADGKVFYTKVGEANITRSVLQNRTVLGAEGGGVIWPEVHPCRDSFAAMALTLEKIAYSKLKVSELMAQMPEYHSALVTMPCNAKMAEDAIRAVANSYERFHPEQLDGVRIPMGKVWALIRKSNSESAIRIYVESAVSEADAQGMAETFRKDLEKFLPEA